jgi:hypothetical protein
VPLPPGAPVTQTVTVNPAPEAAPAAPVAPQPAAPVPPDATPSAPLDGTAQTVVLGTVDTKVDGGVWKTVATIVGVVLGIWLVLMGLLIGLVMFARRRRGVSRQTPIRRRPPRATPDA